MTTRPRPQADAVPGPELPVYVISVAAELTGLHPQTLRTYDRLGLVTPGRTGGGGRRYSLHDIEVLREVAELSASGIGLEGIRRILRLETEVAALRLRNAELAEQLEGAIEAFRELQQRSARAGAVRPASRPSNLPVLARPAPGSAVVVWRRQRGL